MHALAVSSMHTGRTDNLVRLASDTSLDLEVTKLAKWGLEDTQTLAPLGP